MILDQMVLSGGLQINDQINGLRSPIDFRVTNGWIGSFFMYVPKHNVDFVTDEIMTRYYWCAYCGDLIISEDVDHPKPHTSTVILRHYNVCKRRIEWES